MGLDANKPDDLRATLNAAFEKAESSTPDAEPVEPVEAAPEAEVAEVEAPEAEVAETDEAAPADAKGERNTKGQFVAKGKPAPAKTPAAPPKPGEQQAIPPAQPAAQAAPTAKAPQSWTVAEREAFAKAAPEVQKAVLRREHQMQAKLSESAPAVKAGQEFQSAVAPYEAMIRAEGGDPVGAVKSLLQTAAALRTAPPAHKAAIVMDLIDRHAIPVDENAIANLIRSRGLSVERLAQALDGKAVPQQAQRAAQPSLDPNALMAEMEKRFQTQLAQRELAAKQQQSASAYEQFVSDPAHEFADDEAVRSTMADLIELAGRRGQDLSYKDAYSQALLLPQHAEIQAVLKQREEAQRATAPAQVAATRRAQVAGSSVRSRPAGAAAQVAPQPNSLREQLEANAKAHGW